VSTPDPDPEPDPGEPGSAATVAAPAYFVGETPLGTRLYREFRRVEADNPVDEALALIAAGDSLDPDYDTLLPPGSARLASSDPIVVEIPAEWATRPEQMSAEQAALAVQQIVYTVQGVLAERAPVAFHVAGADSAIFGIDEAPYDAAPQLDVLALASVTSPEEGQSVSDTFTASGVASSFEATVIWQVRDAAGEPVLEGFATAEGWLERLYPWQAEVDVTSLAPGTYTFVAMTDDPSGGTEGPGPTEDTKTITVG
jgi:hypothetical protein